MLLETHTQADTLILRLRGDWSFEHLEKIAAELEPLRTHDARQVRVECAELRSSSLAAAWLLRNRLEALHAAGAAIEFAPAPPEHFEFLQGLQARADRLAETPEPNPSWHERWVAAFGRQAVLLARHGVGHVEHLGRVLVTVAAALRHPQHFRLASVVRHIYEAGIQAVPIVALIAFFVSVIIAYIGASQLRGFGAAIYTVDLIAVGVLRELGVLLTAVIVAGRSGSAFAAEIGVMQLNEEVDALRSIGLDPVEVLVVPRVLGLIVALPLLTIVADLMGLAGGALLSNWLLGISIPQFMDRLQDALAPTTFWAGLIKSPVFAVLIAMIGTYRGMQVRDSSRELGRLTTMAVVESIFMVIFANAIFAVVFVELDF